MTLKPMGVGEILDHTFKMFFAQFKSYLAIAALGTAPLLVLGLLVLGLYYLLGEKTAIIGALVAIIPYTAISLAMTGGIIKKASAQIADQTIDVKEAYRFGFCKAWPLFLSGLLFGFALFIGLILLIVPGIYIAISFSLFYQTIIIEDRGPWEALRRSRNLIKGTWWRVFGILLLISLLMSIVRNIICYPLAILGIMLLGPVAGQIVNIIPSTLLALLLTPFSLIAFTLLYYDLRIRKESLDLKIMVDNLIESSSKPIGEQA